MSVKPIVVGVDGSPEATQAAVTAWRMAVALGVPLELVYAIPDVWGSAVMAHVPMPSDVNDRLVHDAHEQMTAQLRTALPAAALAGLRVVQGRPEAALMQAAATARLLVLGGKHHGALARHLGGSTAHFLIRAVDVPVLVTARPTWPLQRVLAAVDLSFAAEATLTAARDLARVSDARVRVLHVIEPLPVPRFLAPDFNMDVLAQRAVEEFHRCTADLADVAVADRVTRRGLAAEMIAAEVADWQADVVVMATQGRGWFDRWLIGSVTQAVLTRLPASILVVPVRAVRVAEARNAHEQFVLASSLHG